jgi:hypothetical protein
MKPMDPKSSYLQLTMKRGDGVKSELMKAAAAISADQGLTIRPPEVAALVLQSCRGRYVELALAAIRHSLSAN